jgi:hypothetical protein
MSKALALRKQIYLRNADYFLLTREGLLIMDDPDFNLCEKAYRDLNTVKGAVQFAIGDLLLYMDGKFGEMVSQLEEDTGYTRESLANFKSVAKAFPILRRRENVEYSFYKELQGLPEETQEKILDDIKAPDRPSLNQKEIRVIKRALGNRRKIPTLRTPHVCSNVITLCLDCGRIHD